MDLEQNLIGHEAGLRLGLFVVFFLVHAETNSNFGFNMPWWDRLFGTYRDQPRAGHDGITIGLHGHEDLREVAHLDGMLLMPFKALADGYAINQIRQTDR